MEWNVLLLMGGDDPDPPATSRRIEATAQEVVMSSTASTTATRSSAPGTSVSATFNDRDSLARAVERLSEKSVPGDSVRVFVDDGAGGRREIPVEDESGALRGAFVGAAIGTIAGIGIVIAVALGLYGPADVGVLSFRGVAGALRDVFGVAAAAVPVGAVLGLGYWQGRKTIASGELDGGEATVVVQSDELFHLARQVLEETGGARITTDDG
jgi:hypothetical protein